MFKKLIFGLVAALFPFYSIAQALENCTQYRAVNLGITTDWFKSNVAAVGNYVAQFNASSGTGCIPGGSRATLAYVSMINATNAQLSRTVTSYSGECVATTGAPTSASVSLQSRTGLYCEPSPCVVGQGYTFNRTEAWSRTPELNAPVLIDLGPPSTAYGYNDGVCVGNLLPEVKCWKSQTPSAQGLYRASCEYTMVVTGDSSGTPSDPNTSPSTPNALCPGSVGTVNGKTVCVGTASNPLPAPTDPPSDPTGAGNPPAGSKPTSGPGSGSTGPDVTPSTGSGGNSGGPASAAIIVGGGGDGEPGEDGTAVCGAPPLPACNVKVDETGVPPESSAAQRFQQGLTDLAQVETDAQAKINEAEESDLPEWSWTFALPTGCAPYAMDAFGLELDVCQFQPIIHDIMSFLWLSAGVFGLIALFRQSVGT